MNEHGSASAEDPLAQGHVGGTLHEQIEMIMTPFRKLSYADDDTSPPAKNGGEQIIMNGDDGSIELNPLVEVSSEDGHADDHKDDGHGGGAPGSASNPQVVINIVISFVGAGLLGIPNAFAKAGWFLGSVTLIIVSALNLYAMLLLPQVKRRLISKAIGTDAKQSIVSYGDLGRIILGPHGEALVNVCLGISQAGFATAYIIFIAANLYSVARIPRFIVCLFCVPGLSFLVSLKEMKLLAPFSLLANAANFSALLTVLVQDFGALRHHRAVQRQFDQLDNNITDALSTSDATDTTDTDIDENPVIHAVRWGGFLYVIAITIYSMEGIGLILSLESSAKQPHMFLILLKATVSCITVFMAFFGSVGYMAFGDNTMAPITLNLTGRVAGTFVKCALSLGLYLTYPIMMFPIWNIAERISPRIKDDTKLNKRFRVGVVCLSALVALMVPDFGKFLSLVGSSICTILGFILPCYFHYVAFGKELAEWQYNLNMFLIVGGSLFGIIGTCQSFVAMLKGDLESEVRRLEGDF